MEAFDMFIVQIMKAEDPLVGSELPRTYWHLETAAAEKYKEPGLFTALIVL